MLRDSQFLRDFGRIQSHALRVSRCFTVTKIDGCTQSLERVLITALDFPKRCFKLPCPLFDHFLEALTVVLHLLLQALFFQGALETCHDNFDLQGFDEIIVRTSLHCFYANSNVFHPRHHDESQMPVSLSNLGQEGHA